MEEQLPEHPLNDERPEQVERRPVRKLSDAEMEVDSPEPTVSFHRPNFISADGGESGQAGDTAFIGQTEGPGHGQILGQEEESGFWAIVRSNPTAIGEAQWIYDVDRVAKGTAGYGGWQKYESGRSLIRAYNAVENYNYAAGAGSPSTPYGNGATYQNLHNDDPEEGYDFNVQPCPPGVVVWIRVVPVDDQEQPEYWFEYVNGVDGTCTEDTVLGDEPGVS